MKIVTFLVALYGSVSLSTANAEGGKHLFILSGQSNMVGLKAEKSFIPAVKAEFGNDQVIVVKDAQSGCPIRRWHKAWKPAPGVKVAGKGKYKYGDLYDRLMAKVMPAIKGQTLKSVTFIWMQGERDAKEKHGEIYASSFVGLVDQVKKDLKRDDVNFVIGRISDFDMNDKKYQHWTKVREAQVKVAESDPRGSWVDTDDFNGKGNQLHYDGAGYTQLGKRFAEEAIALVKKPKG